MNALFFAPHAWVGGRWRERVLLEVADDGTWAAVTPDIRAVPTSAVLLAGPALPGLVNGHSHAFQRAFAGLAERRDAEHDDFWSWRDRMYDVALRLSPEQLRAIATHLYVELLRGGYTQVCEFHYLQHGTDGRPYDDPLTMSWALADAAADAGTGLTLLPVLYERADFDQPALRDDQRRFAAGAQAVWTLQQEISTARRPRVNAGVAMHSLRAASAPAIAQLLSLMDGVDGPIHIHVAEQQREVETCLAATGRRPIEWLAAVGLDARWQLVHATHATPAEIEAVAASGAGVVLCPGTEANLGDGLADVPRWLAAGVPLAVGSDSQVTRAWREELRWLEYGQRLALKQRNVAAAPQAGQPATAERLWQRVLDGGAAAAGFSRWGFEPGARADLLVVDLEDHAMLGVPHGHWLDALVFSSPGRPWRDVVVGGHFVIANHRHADAPAIAARFEGAMHALWNGGTPHAG